MKGLREEFSESNAPNWLQTIRKDCFWDAIKSFEIALHELSERKGRAGLKIV
jgi:hypothetical protein